MFSLLQSVTTARGLAFVQGRGGLTASVLDAHALADALQDQAAAHLPTLGGTLRTEIHPDHAGLFWQCGHLGEDVALLDIPWANVPFVAYALRRDRVPLREWQRTAGGVLWHLDSRWQVQAAVTPEQFSAVLRHPEDPRLWTGDLHARGGTVQLKVLSLGAGPRGAAHLHFADLAAVR